MKKIFAIFTAVLLPHLLHGEELIIFHAGSLSSLFFTLEKEFEKENPGVNVLREAAGSVMSIRKIKELGKPADIVAVADIDLISHMLYPDFVTSYIGFATNRMVIAFKKNSKYAEEINAENWFEILTREDVKVGRSDPNNDPCGYRTLLLWKLSEKYYKKPNLFKKLLTSAEKRFIRAKETDLISLQEAGEIDYHFQYESVARENNFEYLILPPEIDLSEPEFSEFYSSVSVEIRGKTPQEKIKITASPILYGIGLLKGARNPELAWRFITFLLSAKGRKTMEEKGLKPVFPPLIFGNK